MTSPVIPTPINQLPPAPLATDSREEFNDKAFPFVAALSNLASQTNTQSLQTNQNAISAAESAASGESSASTATISAASASSSAASAQAAAAAAQSSAGLPAIAGKKGYVLKVKPDETGVDWGSAYGFEIGSIYTGAKKPTSGVWLNCGLAYLLSSYGNLANIAKSFFSFTSASMPTAYNQAICVHNSSLIVVESTGYCSRSFDDGVTWARVSMPSGFYRSVCSDGSVLVAVGDAGLCATSSDGGATWAKRTLPTTAGYWGVCPDGAGGFVAVGSTGAVARSGAGGVTWTQKTADSRSYRCVALSQGKIIALGLNSACIQSTDNGETWAASTLVPSNANIQGMAAGTNGKLFAVSGGGSVFCSSDNGESWTRYVVQTSALLRSITMLNDVLITVGDTSFVATSHDGGQTWNIQSSAMGSRYGITSLNNKVFAVGVLGNCQIGSREMLVSETQLMAPKTDSFYDQWIKADD